MANKNNNDEKAIVIGKAKFVDFPAFAEWCLTEEADKFFSVENLWAGRLYHLQGELQGVNVSKVFDRSKNDNWFKDNRKKCYVEPLKKCVDYMELFPDASLSFKLLYEHEDKFDIIAFGTRQFIVPKWAIEKELLKDYSDIALAEIRTMKMLDGMGTGIIPVGSALSTVSQASIKAQIDEVNAKHSDLKTEMDDVKNAKKGELAKMQAEIDKMMAKLEAKKQDMLAELLEKEEFLNAEMKKMKQELYMLESEIYSIRCFLGEVVDFVKLRSGAPAPVNAPVTLFQKMRFLDEELGKLVSVYGFDFDDIKLFERLLQKREDIVDVFCPNDKCVSLVRISKTNSYYAYDDIKEMLCEFEVYHGMTIGILIRNGENLYIGWTDDEKINIHNDNFFYTPDTKQVDEEDVSKHETTSVTEMVSRYFVFSILQGALCNTDIIALPEEVKADFTRPSEYIIYSVADTWLTDNRYGTFADMVARCNSRIVAGDDILSIEWNGDGKSERGILGGYGYTRSFERDHNDSRRTGDVAVHDGAIYKIRLVEKDEEAKWESDKIKYFVSLKKNDNMGYVYRGGDFHERQRDAYALFRVYTDEFINLTYMNSTWLKYCITTQNLGSGKDRLTHFAETVRYLNRALKFVKEREVEEAKWLGQYVEITDDMWAALSEWKLEKNVRSINDYQAKRFAKWYNK